jgi:hypothetical protein
VTQIARSGDLWFNKCMIPAKPRQGRLARIHVIALLTVALSVMIACATTRQSAETGQAPDPSASPRKSTAERWIENRANAVGN